MNKTIKFSTEWIAHIKNGDKSVTVRDENLGFGVFAVADENGVLTGDYINVYEMVYLKSFLAIGLYWLDLELKIKGMIGKKLFEKRKLKETFLLEQKKLQEIKTLYGDRTDLYIHYFFLCNEDGSRV